MVETREGLISLTLGFAGFLGSRLSALTRISGFVCIRYMNTCLGSDSLPCLYCQSPGISQVWTTSVCAPNICFQFFPGPLETDSAFHHSHTPGIVKLETSAVLLLLIKDSVAEREISGIFIARRVSFGTFYQFCDLEQYQWQLQIPQCQLCAGHLLSYVILNICSQDVTVLQNRCIITIQM